MLDSLSEKLQGIFSNLRSKGRLSEEDINAAMREIRLALLEADVNFKVVKRFIARAKERCLTSEVLSSLTPAQNVVNVVMDELAGLLGGEEATLTLSSRIPNVIMLVGLQGSGKTTAAAKLAYLLKRQNHNPLLCACDVYRPAAADQLETLGSEIGVRVYRSGLKDQVQIAKDGVRDAIESLRDVVIIDTAGRLHVDDAMMDEAQAIKDAVEPDQIFMVVDAMTGQDAVSVADAFAKRVDFDGVIMSKMDGDARGGAALSIKEVTGKPIAYISQGERPDSLEVFHPERMAKRILGMGDVLSIIESARAAQTEEIKAEEAVRMARGNLTFNDFLTMQAQVGKMGGVQKLISALPGGDKAMRQGQVNEHALDHIAVIIGSMTAYEREHPECLNGSRKARIAGGAGVSVFQVNQLIKQFNETKKMMRQMMNAQAGTSNRKSRKGKKKKKGRAGRGGLPGMAGLSMADVKKMQEMMASLDDSSLKR